MAMVNPPKDYTEDIEVNIDIQTNPNPNPNPAVTPHPHPEGDAHWESEMQIAAAMEKQKRTSNKRKLCLYGIILLGVVAISVGIALAVRGPKVDAPTPVPMTPGPTPTNANEVRDVIVANSRFGGSEFESDETHQSKALEWTLTQDFPSEDIPLTFDEQILQTYALACIYFSTNAVRSAWTDFHYGPDVALPGWFSNRGWVQNADEVCNWYGVTCNDEMRVEKIELDTNGLTGSFPSEVALLKDSLKYLDLYNNLVHNKDDEGNAWLGELVNIEKLFYGTTSFEYDGIPTEIGLLTNLQEYDMSYTLYFGELTGDMWTNLVNLNYLVMDGNAYNSTIPQQLMDLPDLEYLYAGFSFLEGNLDFLPNMPKIFELWMDDNPGLSGPIPSTLPNADTLVSMSATNCGLTGTIPTELGLMTDMIQMWFYDNDLTGTIPTELGQMIKMKVLNLQKNDLTGEMPSQLCSRRTPFGRLDELEADCDGEITCADTCCTCCGEDCISV